MDPNECLRRIDEMAKKRSSTLWNSISKEAGDLCVELNSWLEKGGFEPEWNKYPDGAAYFRFVFP